MNSCYSHLVALPQENSQVYLSWRKHTGLKEDTEFFVQRKGPENWEIVSPVLVKGTTYLDKPPFPASYEYRIGIKEKPDWISETVKVDTLKQTPTNIWLRTPLPVPAEDYRHCIMADLDNDGRMDFVIRYCEGGRVKLGAIRGDGKPMWTIDTALPAHGGWDSHANHVPFLCWDVDHDGRTEIVYHHGSDAWKNENDVSYERGKPEEELLIVADGETGETKRTCPWPGEKARIMMTIGYLKGFDMSPQIVVLDESYGNETITAIDGATAQIYWRKHQVRPAGHNLDIGDIDNDGIQEVICGGVCYRGNGEIFWEAEPFGHTDMSKPANIDPGRPGMEIWYLVENDKPGVYLVDSKGRTIFHESYKHAHFGWIAKYTTQHSGLQLHAAEDRRRHDNEVHHPVFLSDGTHWAKMSNEHSRDLMPVQWDSGDETVFIHRKQHVIVRYNQNGTLEPLEKSKLPSAGVYGRNIICADIIGDYREDIVTVDKKNSELIGITNTSLNTQRKISPMESFYYRHDRSQHGSGYYLYVPPHE